MIKYFCDICNTDTTENPKVATADFGNGVFCLCNSCFPKFKNAKESLYDEYSESYSTLNSEYVTDLKNAILNNVDPEPIWDNP